MADKVLRAAIDFGSTNSVISWQLYQKQGEDLQALTARKPYIYPTKIIEKYVSKINGEYYPNEDVFANEAVKLQKQMQYVDKNLKVKTDFKRALLFPKSEYEHTNGYQLTKKFFEFLYSKFMEDNSLPAENNYSMELYLTAPLGVQPKSLQELEKIAAESGFSKQNGFEKITVINEAQCLVFCAFTEDAQELMPHLQELARDTTASKTALFVDIGGLTGDFILASIRYDDKKKDFIVEEKAMDLSISDGSDLGGIELDKALLEYLGDCKLVDAQTAHKYADNQGYQFIREYKEFANNEHWSKGSTPDDIGGIPNALAQWTESGTAAAPLEEYDNHLTPDTVENVVFEKYIKRFGTRVNDYLKKVNVPPDSVDWVFLTGGGSKMFFIPKIFTGECAAKNDAAQPLKLTKIIEDKTLLFHPKEDPTTSCIRGVLSTPEHMQIIRSSNSEYFVRMTVNFMKGIIKDQETEILIPMANQNQQYPIHVEGSRSIKYEMSSLMRIEVKVSMVTSKDKPSSTVENMPMDSKGMIDAEGARMTMRKNNKALAGDVAAAGKGLLMTVGLGALGILVPSLRTEASNVFKYEVMNNKIKFDNKYYDTLTIDYDFTIDKNGKFTGTIRGSSPVLNQNDGHMELVII